MSTEHCCLHCLQPLTFVMELGELVLRCAPCRAHQIERESRHDHDRREGYTKPWWNGNEL